jgi:aminopeptidase
MDFEEKLNILAKNLVNYSIGEQFKEKGKELKNQKIAVFGEAVSEPLLIAIEREIVKAGAYPMILPFFKNHHRRFYAGIESFKYGTKKHVEFIPDFYKTLFDEASAFINILGTENPNNEFNNFSNKVVLAQKVFSPLLKKRTSKIWTLALYPTKELADFEGMDYEEYKNFILDTSIVNYKEFKKNHQTLVDLISKSSDVIVKTENYKGKDLELYINIQNRIGISSHGLRNIPDGEVFTSPNANSLEGEVFFDLPIYNNGVIEGVYLKFEKGKIIDFNANKGYDILKSIIETDKGSRQIGEFAFGTNYKVTKSLKEILFAEKIGGTCHMAIGCSYDWPYEIDKMSTESMRETYRNNLIKTGIYSYSAQHVDFPFHPKKVLIDGNEVRWDGKKWFINN